MKFKLRFITALTLIFMMISSSNVYATVDNNIGIEFTESYLAEIGKQYNKDVQATYDKLSEANSLAKDDDYALIDSKEEVLVNKIFDANTIKQSYNEPVILYKERIENNYYADSPLAKSSYVVQTKEVIENTSYAYAGIIVSVSVKVVADRLDDSGVYYYKMKKITNSWETSNGASDGFGGYVSNQYICALQIGYSYETSSVESCVEYENENSFASNTLESTKTKYFYPDYHTAAAGPGYGVCGEYVNLDITFVNTSAPNQIYTMSDDYNIGWGGIWQPDL